MQSKDCHLENLRISCRYKESYPFGNLIQIRNLFDQRLSDTLQTVFRRLKRVIPRVRSLTIASDGAGAPWSLSLLLRTFRTLPNLERLTVATDRPHITETPHFWSAIDAICGSGRVYDSLETWSFVLVRSPRFGCQST
jgi:hypothetical protein